ncbi:methionyl-tRNA formyltransferase [Pseudomonadota bacterium]
MKIVFMGTPDFAVPTLKKLIDSEHKILAVYTKEPKKVDRGQKIKKTPIHRLAEENGINVFIPKKLSIEEKRQLIELNPDICIVVAYGMIIPLEILNIPKHGFLNVHASLLPRWRGADPIRRAILEGDSITGISIMQVTEGLDEGDVLASSSIGIEGKNIRYENLYEELAKEGGNLLLQVLNNMESKPGKIKKIKQNENKSTYAKKIKKEDGKIDWMKSAEKIFRQIMALSASPGVYFEYKGEKIKVFDAEVETNFGTNKYTKYNPGTVVEENSNKFCILCGNGIICLKKLQRPGKNSMCFREFLRGFPIKIGEILK